MRPYYNDPYTTEFEAVVTASYEAGGNHVVVLDNTFFYPTSGGQEHDTGRIGDSDVVDVIEEDGRIVHVVTTAVGKGPVRCRIDKDRRFGNMQQHTGQHILSAAFENLFGIETVSSRLGEYVGTIDLSRMPSGTEVSEAVQTANRIIRENRPVAVRYAEHDELAALSLRKAPKVEGTVRIIDVRDFDMSPCGGTHCTHTSEIGVVLTGSLEKVKSSLTRIEFFCGERALRRYYELLGSVTESSKLLSSGAEDLPAAVEKLRSQLKENESRIRFLSDRLLEGVCRDTLPIVEKSGDSLAVVDLSGEVQGTDELRFVASCVSKKTKKSFAFHRGEGNICYVNLNLNLEDDKSTAIMNELRTTLGVKGGGRSGFFSITFEASRMEEVFDFIRGKLANG